jgi:hypothetical protein
MRDASSRYPAVGRVSFVPIRLVGLTLLLPLAACPSPVPPADGLGQLRVRFLYDGQPHAATLTVANGDFRQRWENVTEIDARVPPLATYTIDATMPGAASPATGPFRDIIPEFRVPEGDTLEILVHLPGPGLPKPFEPVLLIEEARARAVVTNRVEPVPGRPGSRRLTSSVQAETGALVVLDGIYRDPDAGPDSTRAFTCGEGCPHIFQQVDCSTYCYGCSSTVITPPPGGHYKGNVNMCSLTAGSDPEPTSVFEEIAAGSGGVYLTAVLRRDAALVPLRAELAGAGEDGRTLEPPLRNRSYPDFVAPVGVYRYAVTVPAGAGSERYVLPVRVEDGRILELLVRLQEDALPDLEPRILADDRLGVVTREVATTRATGSVEVRVSTADPDPGTAWIVVQLPTGATLRDVTDARTGQPRVEGEDYVSAEHAGATRVTVRTTGSDDTFAIRWTP